MNKTIRIKKETYEKLEKLKDELNVRTYNDVIEKLIMTYESLKKHQEFTQVLQDLDAFYRVWDRIKGYLSKMTEEALRK